MYRAFRRWIARAMRIPPEPTAPYGAPGSTQIFRAGVGYLRYQILYWLSRQSGVLLGILVLLVFPAWNTTGWLGSLVEVVDPLLSETLSLRVSTAEIVRAIEFMALAGFVIQLPVSLAMVLLDYECRWYIVTDRSLRVREGVTRVDERTMTFSNIQNISIHQGPIQRWFGIADLDVQTAGGGESSSSDGGDYSTGKRPHLAKFRGIPNAPEVRDIIRGHLKRQRQSGLGDPDEARSETARPLEPVYPQAVLGAAQALLDEVRALRTSYAGNARPRG